MYNVALSGSAIISLTVSLLKISHPGSAATVTSAHGDWLWGLVEWKVNWFFPSLPKLAQSSQIKTRNLSSIFHKPFSGFLPLNQLRGPPVTPWVQGSISALAWTTERPSKWSSCLWSLDSLHTVLSVVRKQIVLVSPRPKRDLKFFTLMCLWVGLTKRFTFSQGRIVNTLSGCGSPSLPSTKCPLSHFSSCFPHHSPFFSQVASVIFPTCSWLPTWGRAGSL